MTTQDQSQSQQPSFTLEDYLRDPLAAPEGFDPESLATGTEPEDQADGKQAAGQGQEDAATQANKQGDSNGAAPGTGKEGDEGAQKQEEGAAAAQPAGESVVLAKDGKHTIPYSVLERERETRIRAEAMVVELNAKMAADQHAAESGKGKGTRDLSEIVDEEVMAQLREESPQLADKIQKLVDLAKTQGEELKAAQPARDQAAYESRVQHMVSVEDAIAANPTLYHVRQHDPATFTAIAQFDTMLQQQDQWKDKPLPERFGAALRMYEAANGAIEVPGTQQAKPNPPAAQHQPADTAKRVDEAVAKAKAAASQTGPSTLSDIPGGSMAAPTQSDALQELSSAALTERFLDMSPEQIEAQLARF